MNRAPALRRPSVALVAAIVVWSRSCRRAAGAAGGFDLDDVADKARSSRPSRSARRSQVPDWLLKITYDQWRDIRFRPERALWRDRQAALPGAVLPPRPVLRSHRRDQRRRRRDGASRSRSRRASSTTARTTSRAACRRTSATPASASTTRSRRTDYYDEVIVFLGASYFRAVGRDQVFGLSARGLAIDTARVVGRGVPVLPRVLARDARRRTRRS